MVKITAEQYLLVKYADSRPVNLNYGTPDSNFKYVTVEYDTEDPNLLKKDDLLVENLYLSNDPAQKGWFSPSVSYHPVYELNKPAPARGIARVLKSNSDQFKEGDIISAKIDWATHNIINVKDGVLPADPSLVQSVHQFISVLGTTTITAYLAIFKYSHVKPEDEGKVWLVTGAAGAVGSTTIHLLDRLFKPKKIIAVAGGAEKVKIVSEISDKVVAIDYRSSTYDEDFKKALGDDQIDVFIDQVGGQILNKAFPYLRVHGRVVQVGAVSTYNSSEPFVFSNYGHIITKRLSIQGMVIVDDIADFQKIIAHLAQELKSGNLDISAFKETVVDATGRFKDVPEIWTGLFSGKNVGKYITKIKDYKP